MKVYIYRNEVIYINTCAAILYICIYIYTHIMRFGHRLRQPPGAAIPRFGRQSGSPLFRSTVGTLNPGRCCGRQ